MQNRFMQIRFFSEREREKERERESSLSVRPAKIYAYSIFSRNSENIQVVDTSVIIEQLLYVKSI